MTFAADMQALEVDIAALIAEAGNTMTLRRSNPSSINTTTGAVAFAPPESEVVKGVVGAYSIEEQAKLSDLERYQRGDFPVTFASSVAPQVGDRLIVGSKSYSLLSVDRIGAADVVVVYQAQARGT